MYTGQREYIFDGVVTRVIDGDTVELDIDLGFGIIKRNDGHSFRLANIDTPETRLIEGVNEVQKAHGIQARDFLKHLIEGQTVRIQTFKNKTGKYGRYLVEIYLVSGDYSGMPISDVLKTNGFEKRSEY